ncbi:hypothetical protein Tco_1578403 [Tanacetum coccineum]
MWGVGFMRVKGLDGHGEDSTVTYTVVSSQFRGLSDIRSLGVDGLPMILEDPYVEAALQASPSPNYVSGPKYPPSPEFVPEPIYPEFMPPEDELFPAEEQPLHAAISPTADSPRYIADSDPEEDEEVPKEDLIDYPADRGDNDDDDDELSDDDEDDDDVVEEDEDEEEEEKHPALADSIARLLVIPSPLPLPLSSWSSPLPQISSPPLRASSPVLVSPPPLPAKTPPLSTPPSGTPPLLPIPTPTSSPSLLLPSANHGADRPEVCLPPQKRLCITLGPRYEVGESSSALTARPTGGFRADYGFVATLDREIRRDPERYDTGEIYVRLDDAKDERSLMSGQLKMLFRDRRTHAYIDLLIEREARLPCEAWRWSLDASNTARSEVRALRTTVLVHYIVLAARDRQNSYADLKHKLMEFQVRDKAMIKVSPWKGVVCFGKRGKLNPRYVGPFKVLEKVGAVAYKFGLPQELSRVHNTFHVSNMKKCYADETLAVLLDGLHINDKLHFVEEPVEIMDRDVKQLKRSRILIIKVRWNSKRDHEFTWEHEDQFRKKYPHLFTKTTPSSSVGS